MKFKFVKGLNEGGLSRVWSHIHTDERPFAIIGSQDKDTKEDRSEKLLELVNSCMKENKSVGFKPLFGRYQYEDGTIGEELSLIIYNISKDKAMEIMRDVNQESIIWKDTDYFGFLDAKGEEDGRFSTDEKNINFTDEDIKFFGSRLAKHKNKNQLKPFKFIMEQYTVNCSSNAVRNMGAKERPKETLFQIDL